MSSHSAVLWTLFKALVLWMSMGCGSQLCIPEELQVACLMQDPCAVMYSEENEYPVLCMEPVLTAGQLAWVEGTLG